MILTFEADVGDALLKAAEADLQDEILTQYNLPNCRILSNTHYSTGAVGISEVPAALLRWMVAGPELARVVHEFMAHQEGILNVK